MSCTQLCQGLISCSRCSCSAAPLAELHCLLPFKGQICKTLKLCLINSAHVHSMHDQGQTQVLDHTRPSSCASYDQTW